jgi:hypothetical protein
MTLELHYQADYQITLIITLSFVSGLSIEKPFVIYKKTYFTTGIGLHQQMYFMDGYFTKAATGNVFKQSENGTVNNKLEFTTIKIPMLFSFDLFSKNNNSIVFSTGTDVDFFVSGRRKFKQFAGSKTLESFSVDNKLQVPIRFEISTLSQSKGRTLNDRIFFGFGARRQLTNYLKSSPSFKPLELNFRLGAHL